MNMYLLVALVLIVIYLYTQQMYPFAEHMHDGLMHDEQKSKWGTPFGTAFGFGSNK